MLTRVPWITEASLEQEARVLLREQIERSAWYRHNMGPDRRAEAIEQDVERYWRFKLLEAFDRLNTNLKQGI